MTGMIGIIAALLTAASWALASVLFKELSEHFEATALTYAKSLACSLLLLAVVLGFGMDAPPLRDAGLLFLSGILGILVGDTLFFKALQRLTPQALTVLLMCGQVLTAVLATLFLSEQIALPVWSGLGLVLLGLYALMYPDSANSEIAESEQTSACSCWGIVYGIGAILCMSISMIISKPALDTNSTFWATLIRMSSGFIGMFFWGWYIGRFRVWNTIFIDRKYRHSFFLAVCVITFGGFWLSMVALKYAPVAIASTLMGTEPLFALPFVALIQHKRIRTLEYLGAFLATCGLTLVVIFNK